METKEDDLQVVYDWVDNIPLSRAKKNISRDFADGVLMAEVIHHEFPRIIEVHNYSAQNGIPHRQYNWETLNQKVFKHHLGFTLSKAEILSLCKAENGAVDGLLKLVKSKLAEKKMSEVVQPGSPQHRKAEGKANFGVGNSETPADADAKRSGEERLEEETDAAKEAIEKLQYTNKLLKQKIEKLKKILQLKDVKIAGLSEQLASHTAHD